MNTQLKLRKRPRRFEVCWTVEEYNLLAQRAQEADATISDYVRRVALGKKIILEKEKDKLTKSLVGELRKIGALIKHNYPLVKSWSQADRKKYWQTREELLAIARKVSEKMGSKERERNYK